MSSPGETRCYGPADLEHLSDIHADHISRALDGDDRGRDAMLGEVVACLANAIAFFSGSDEARAVNVANVIEDLPALVESCHADITGMRGTKQ